MGVSRYQYCDIVGVTLKMVYFEKYFIGYFWFRSRTHNNWVKKEE